MTPQVLSVRITPELAEALGVLSRAGMTPSDAARTAVIHLAATQQIAIDHGDTAPDKPVHILGVVYRADDGTTRSTSPYDTRPTEATP